MKDQADTLRKLMEQRGHAVRAESLGPNDAPDSIPAPVLSFTSGKGGTGKTSLVANLGSLLAKQGQKVLLVDADFGLANLDILFNARAQVTIEQVLAGKARIQDAILGIEPNLWLLPAASGLVSTRDREPGTRAKVMQLLEHCPWEMDLILVDGGAGVHDQVISLHHPWFKSVIVLTPEPTSLADAYGLMKVVRAKTGVFRFQIIVNQVEDAKRGQQVFQRLADVAAKFSDMELTYLGHVERDEKIPQSILKQKILIDLDAEARSVSCLDVLARRIRSERPTTRVNRQSAGIINRFQPAHDESAREMPGNTARFWRTLLGEVKA